MEMESERVRRLYGRRTFGIKPGIERVGALLDCIGHPEREIAAVHVAGTNGKGSVCAMVESVLRLAGFRTGFYSSPHLVRMNERIRVAGAQIPDAALDELIDELEPHAAAVARDHGDVTFFEFTTALAFEYFRRQKARLVVLETGMGGRLDATNVVTPLVSVITRISIEHAKYLGADEKTIAGEKSGIIKRGRPVVCGDMPPDALDAVKAVARREASRCVLATDAVAVRRKSQDLSGQRVSIESADASYPSVRLPLLGRHQLENCAVAVAAIEEACRCAGLEIGEGALKAGLEAVEWPARCEVLSRDPPVLLDGAHNPGAAEVLAAAVEELAGGKPVGLVIGMCDDKDLAGFLKPFSRLVKRCWSVPLNDERGLQPAHVASQASAHGWTVTKSSVEKALGESERWAKDNSGLVCIAGSLYLAGEVLSLRKRVLFGRAAD